MVQQVPGSFGTETKPVILDISQLIRNVAWVVGGVIVITLDAEISYTVTTGEPEMSWSALIQDSNIPSIRGASLLEGLGARITEPGPPTKEQKKDNDFYHYAPRNTSTSETTTTVHHFVDRGIFHIFTNAGTITFHEDPIFGIQVPFIIDYRPEFAGIDGDVPPQGYDAFGVHDPGTMRAMRFMMDDVVGHLFTPFPSGVAELLFEELVGHNDTTTATAKRKTWKTMTFINTPRVLKNKDIKEAGKITFRMRLEGATSRQFIRFKLGVHTWRGVKTFTYDANSQYLLKPNPADKEPIDAKFEETNRSPEMRYPPQQIDFTIDTKTFKVTAVRKAL